MKLKKRRKPQWKLGTLDDFQWRHCRNGYCKQRKCKKCRKLKDFNIRLTRQNKRKEVIYA